MSDISSVNNSLLQSQLANIQLRRDIDIKVARKTLDAAEAQGEAALALLDQAAELAQSMASTGKPALTVGALVSGLGQSLDLHA